MGRAARAAAAAAAAAAERQRARTAVAGGERGSGTCSGKVHGPGAGRRPGRTRRCARQSAARRQRAGRAAPRRACPRRPAVAAQPPAEALRPPPTPAADSPPYHRLHWRAAEGAGLRFVRCISFSSFCVMTNECFPSPPAFLARCSTKRPRAATQPRYISWQVNTAHVFVHCLQQLAHRCMHAE